MKKQFCVIIALAIIVSLSACTPTEPKGEDNNQTVSINTPPVVSPSVSVVSPSPDTAPEPTEVSNTEAITYQSILDEYTAILKDTTPGLIDEYYKEAEENQDGLTGLAEICNNKVLVLANISNEGVSEMAEYYYSHGTGKYSEYEEWAGKLFDVYMDEAANITNAYMDSIT